MTVQEAENRITDQIAARLSELGFKKINHFLIARVLDQAVQQLSFGVRKDRASGDLWVSITVGIRFEQVEQLLQRNDDRNAPTIGIPIYLLHDGRRLVEWNAARPDLTDLLHEQIELYAILFFERIASLEALRLQLMEDAEAQESISAQMAHLNPQQQRELRLKLMDDERLSLPLTADQRTEILAAIAVVNGDLSSAQSMIRNARSDLEHAKPIPPTIARRARLDRLEKILSSKS